MDIFKDIIGFKDYEIFRNGNQFVVAFDNIKMAKRKMKSLSKRGFYVELWACYQDGSRHLVDFMN